MAKSDNNSLQGGIGDNETATSLAEKHNVSVDFINEQLQKGIKVEMEHTDDPNEAEQIAIDHITELGASYYIELEKMESKLKGENTFKSAIDNYKKLNYNEFLTHIVDSYKQNNAVIGVKGYDHDGEEIYGYLPNQYEYMEKSAITGQNIRFYVVLDNKGNYAHPSEVTGKFNYKEQKRVADNADYHLRLANKSYSKWIELLHKSNDFDKVKESLEIALKNDIEIVCDYDSGDLFQNNPLCSLRFKNPDGTARRNTIGWYIRNRGFSYNNLTREQSLSADKHFDYNMDYVDLNRFYKEFVSNEKMESKLKEKGGIIDQLINHIKNKPENDNDIKQAILNAVNSLKRKDHFIILNKDTVFNIGEKAGMTINIEEYFQAQEVYFLKAIFDLAENGEIALSHNGDYLMIGKPILFKGIIFDKEAHDYLMELKDRVIEEYDYHINKSTKGVTATYDTLKLKEETIDFYKDSLNRDFVFHYHKEGAEANAEVSTKEHAETFGIKAEKPLYVSRLFVPECDRNKGKGTEILNLLEDYARANDCDIIFGLIDQKADFTRDVTKDTLYLNNVECIKMFLSNNDYATNDNTNDFHKVLKQNNDMDNEIKIGDIIYHSSESGLRLLGVKEKIKKNQYKVSEFKVIDIYNDKGQHRIVIQNLTGKKISRDKYLDEEFKEIMFLSEKYKTDFLQPTPEITEAVEVESVEPENVKYFTPKTIPTIQTIMNNSWGITGSGDLSQFSDEEILKAWQYSAVAESLYVRNIEPKGYSHSAHYHILPQISNPDNLTKIKVELTKRGLDKNNGIDLSEMYAELKSCITPISYKWEKDGDYSNLIIRTAKNEQLKILNVYKQHNGELLVFSEWIGNAIFMGLSKSEIVEKLKDIIENGDLLKYKLNSVKSTTLDNFCNQKSKLDTMLEAVVEQVKKDETIFEKQMRIRDIAFAKYKAKWNEDINNTPLSLLFGERKNDIDRYFLEARAEVENVPIEQLIEDEKIEMGQEAEKLMNTFNELEKIEPKNKATKGQMQDIVGNFFEEIVSNDISFLNQFIGMLVRVPNYETMALIEDNGIWENFTSKLNVNLWTLIPNELTKANPVKKVVWRPDINDSGLRQIIKDFPLKDNVRPLLNTARFDEKGIVATDAQDMLFIKANHEFRGNYCLTTFCEKNYGTEVKEDEKARIIYPVYQTVIPTRFNSEVTVNAYTILSYINGAKSIKWYATYGEGLIYQIDNVLFGFRNELMQECIKAMLMLGHTELTMLVSEPSRAMVICPKGKNTPSDLNHDFALIMPTMLQGNDYKGRLLLDLNEQCVSTIGITDTSCINPAVIEKIEAKAELQEIKQIAKEAKLKADLLEAENQQLKDDKAEKERIEREAIENAKLQSQLELETESDLELLEIELSL